jgi:hypothetical protein
MNDQKLINDFNKTLDTWMSAPDMYSFDQLLVKPYHKSWSLGQVFLHLIESTSFYLDNIKTCMTTDENHDEKACSEAEEMFKINQFPDIEIEGPESNNDTPQPCSKEQIRNSLIQIKEGISSMQESLLTPQSRGKTKHPGLGFLNAMQWLQFSEMHMRHHLKQKEKIDHYLQNQTEINSLMS